MLLRILSDGHIEFSDGKFDMPELPNDSETVLVLAGDIGVAKHKWSYVPFLEEMSERFREVIYCMGNHEHYKGKFSQTKYKIQNAISHLPNVDLYDNETVVIGDVAFVCSTLWTSMNNSDPNVILQAQTTMNDYQTIRHGPSEEPLKRKLHPRDTIQQHNASKDFIFPEIDEQQKKGKKVVVVTHHAPHDKSLEAERRAYVINDDLLYHCYFTEYFEEIMELQPILWVHGHVHHSNDYMIGNTRVLSNPYGYHNHATNENFNPELLVEI